MGGVNTSVAALVRQEQGWEFVWSKHMSPISQHQRIHVFFPKLQKEYTAGVLFWEYEGWVSPGNWLGDLLIAYGADPITPESRQIMQDLVTLHALAKGIEISEFIWRT